MFSLSFHIAYSISQPSSTVTAIALELVAHRPLAARSHPGNPEFCLQPPQRGCADQKSIRLRSAQYARQWLRQRVPRPANRPPRRHSGRSNSSPAVDSEKRQCVRHRRGPSRAVAATQMHRAPISGSEPTNRVTAARRHSRRPLRGSSVAVPQPHQVENSGPCAARAHQSRPRRRLAHSIRLAKTQRRHQRPQRTRKPAPRQRRFQSPRSSRRSPIQVGPSAACQG